MFKRLGLALIAGPVGLVAGLVLWATIGWQAGVIALATGFALTIVLVVLAIYRGARTFGRWLDEAEKSRNDSQEGASSHVIDGDTTNESGTHTR